VHFQVQLSRPYQLTYALSKQHFSEWNIIQMCIFLGITKQERLLVRHAIFELLACLTSKKDMEIKKLQLQSVLKCYCDENFVFSFPVVLSVIYSLDPKFLESANFFDNVATQLPKRASENHKITSAQQA